MSKKKFRGISIPAEHFELAKNLYALNELTDDLNSLQSVWNNLSLLGELTHIGAEISKTRQDFQTLANELSNCLIEQSLNKVVEQLSAKAQSTIDTLVRNLFERTADIGFLATDEQLKNTCLQASAGALDAQLFQDTLLRLKHYQTKYSVYSNVVLLGPAGEFLMDLQGNTQTQSNFDWVPVGVESKQNYFEAYRAINPHESNQKSLVYAWKLERAHRTIGYVCLWFNLEEEKIALLKRNENPVFSSLQNWIEFGVMDEDNTIIFSTDNTHLGAGTQLPSQTHSQWQLAKIGPIAYLCCMQSTHGYQGYKGPGWSGFALIPLAHAFEDTDDTETDAPAFPTIEWDHTNKRLDSRIIHIKEKALHIQKQLNQSVWNGNIHQRQIKQNLSESFSKTLLWEISKTGEQTRLLFNKSVQNVIDTYTQRQIKKQENNAQLAIEIMDRNLYERANDCRWWALNKVYANCLQNIDNLTLLEETKKALHHTNGLYTVYTDILLFDNLGVVIANSGATDRKGFQLQAAWVANCLALRDESQYVVSRFETTSLYENRPTYIYAAAIHDDPQQPKTALGGIAVVFDSEPQFEAILNEVLGTSNSPSLAYVIDLEGHVVSSNTNRFIAEGKFTFPIDFPDQHAFKKGASFSKGVEIDDTIYCVGVCNSNAYREYKSPQDSYKNNLRCIYLSEMGQAARIEQSSSQKPVFSTFQAKSELEETMEIATFQIGEQWFAFPSQAVVAAIIPKEIARLPGSPGCMRGSMMHKGQAIPILDIAPMLKMPKRKPELPDYSQVLLIQAQELGCPIGILIDDLGEIPNIACSEIQSMSDLGADLRLIKGLIKTENGLLSLLDTRDYENLFSNLV